VARVEPAAAPRRLGRLRVLEVDREESPSGVRAGAAHDEFALRPAGDLTVTLVHHSRLELPEGPAEGARRRPSRIVAVAEDPPGLGPAPHFDQREPEPLLEDLVELGLDARPQTEPRAVPDLVWDPGQGQQQGRTA